MTLIHKSRFLREEHGRMEQEATMSRRVDELEHQLESAHRESQDRAVEATRTWVAELLAAEWVTAAERGLDAVKVHLAETEVALQKSLDALETEQKDRSKVDREVLVLRGRVLGMEDSNARLLKKVTR